MSKQKIITILFITFSTAIIIVGLILRLLIFDKVGGDYLTYKEAVNALNIGENPYFNTVMSFRLENMEHGYAYFPTLMYIQFVIWTLSNFLDFNIATVILWKVPVLLADFLILYFIFKKNKLPSNISELLFNLVLISFWTINPYLIARYDYSLYDPIFLLMILLALEKVEKSSFTSGICYAIAVSLKTIPLIILPLFLVKTPNKIKFIIAGILVFFVISIPFMHNFYDFYIYLRGSFFVHSERALQGRPFLSLISYVTQDFGISFMQQKFVELYSMLALVLAFVIPTILYFKKKINNVYVWTTLSFFIYLILTPILSRTHILWFFPWFLVTFYLFISRTKKWVFGIVILVIIWLSSFLYLVTWNKGMEVQTTENTSVIVIKDSDAEWEFSRLIRQKYYEIRGKLTK